MGCGRHDEEVPTAAVAIAVVNTGVDMVIVFILATEGGGDWHRQWWCERRGERVLTCGCIDDHCCCHHRWGRWWSMRVAIDIISGGVNDVVSGCLPAVALTAAAVVIVMVTEVIVIIAGGDGG